MKVIGNIQKYFNKDFFNTIKSSKIINGSIIALVFFIVVFSTLCTSILPETYDLKIGEKSMTDIKAPMDIEDKEATAKLINSAIEDVDPIEKRDATIQIDIKKSIEKFFGRVYESRQRYTNGEISLQQAVNTVEEYNRFELSKDEISYMIRSKVNEVQSIESYAYEVIMQIMSIGIRVDDLESEKDKITQYYDGLEGFNSNMKNISIKIINSSIRENTFIDSELTQQKINEAIKKVDKVYIKKGTILVSEGEVINENQYKLLEEAGLVNNDKSNKIMVYIGLALITLLLELIIIIYIYFFNRRLIKETSNLYLLTIVFLIIYLIAKPINSISNYLMPVATAPMLIGILINPLIAIIINIVLSIIISLSTGNGLYGFIILLIGGTVGAISTSNTSQRSSIFFSGIIVSITNFLIIFSFGFIQNLEMKRMLIDGFYGVFNGILGSILTIGSLPLWEYVFGILTPIKLLELSNPNHPLLKRVLVEAPGTYHHSIIVGNLSEAAAQAIGCNGLLARVGSYYHDIGKLKRPYFFKENQLTSDNPHDKLTPYISSKIIRNHVTDGRELGNKYKLPEEIIDIISEHHGTSLVKFFYHKALNDEEGTRAVEKKDYQYFGPNPQTKESAIVMIADSVEAAVRSLAEPTKDNIEGLVNKIIKDKLDNGQLSDCDLTLKDIKIITETFINTLMGIFHERIEYPEINEDELEATN